MKNRVNYVDNLRSLTVSFLVLYHIAMAYNSWGEANYIFLERTNWIASIVVFITPWFMPLMFLLAGVSASFALRKRSTGEFIKERFIRLGVPLVFGILVLNPVLSFIADKYHNGYTGSYIEHYGVFFSKVTDITGYDGGFTLGHLWFITVLIIVSIVACGIIKLIDKLIENNTKALCIVNAVLVILAIATYEVRILGKPIPLFLFVYLLGYYLFTNKNAIEKIVKAKWAFVILWLVVSVANVALYVFLEKYALMNTITYYLAFIFSIPAIFALAHDYLDFANEFTRKAAKLSYVFYIAHYPISVGCQYILYLAGLGHLPNFFLSVVISYPLTVLACWIINKIKLLRFLFGTR